MLVTKRYLITLGNISPGPSPKVDFKVETTDGSYRETFKGFAVDTETASRCLALRDGVEILHISKEAWLHESLDWRESVINAALRTKNI